MLPPNPLNWPEPWRAIYLERREERIAIMIESGQSEHAAVVKAAVADIEWELRQQHMRSQR